MYTIKLRALGWWCVMIFHIKHLSATSCMSLSERKCKTCAMMCGWRTLAGLPGLFLITVPRYGRQAGEAQRRKCTQRWSKRITTVIGLSQQMFQMQLSVKWCLKPHYHPSSASSFFNGKLPGILCFGAQHIWAHSHFCNIAGSKLDAFFFLRWNEWCTGRLQFKMV